MTDVAKKPKWPALFIVVGTLVLLLFPINILGYYKREITPFFSGGNFSFMFDFSVPWAILLLVELIVLPLLACLSLLNILLLFKKHKSFPAMLKGLFIAYLVLMVLDLFANQVISEATDAYKDVIYKDIYRNIFRTLLYVVVTVPFLYFSDNVKKTYARVGDNPRIDS
ncbi:DUF2569 family protein [Cohnella suwonensis]|uniref:DUF2569 family protein n=1 Tax=Cohnella suwonensis TaxID=696072 RepID=A0ABW0M0U4_9BACL